MRRDRALVAPVRQHPVAVAQVGGDRAQQLELALGQHEVVPAEAGRSRVASSPSREDDAWRAPQSRSAGSGSARRALGRRSRRPRPRRDLLDREPELRRDVAHVVAAPRERAQAASRSGKRRHRDLDERAPVRSPSASASRARAGQQHGRARGRSSSARSSRCALGGLEAPRARRGTARAALQRGRRARRRRSDARRSQRRARRRARAALRRPRPATAAASGPQTTSGRRVSAREQRARPRSTAAARPPGLAGGVVAAQRAGARLG